MIASPFKNSAYTITYSIILSLNVNIFKVYVFKSHMEIFPIDIQYVIWKTAFSSQVLAQLQLFPVHSLWFEPSSRLKSLCHDLGCYQVGFNDLDDLIEDHNIIYTWSHCLNCNICRFPCSHCSEFLFDNQIAINLFFY